MVLAVFSSLNPKCRVECYCRNNIKLMLDFYNNCWSSRLSFIIFCPQVLSLSMYTMLKHHWKLEAFLTTEHNMIFRFLRAHWQYSWFIADYNKLQVKSHTEKKNKRKMERGRFQTYSIYQSCIVLDFVS